MRIAIPTENGQLCPHFGHCEKFAILEVDPSSRSVLSTEFQVPPAHEPGVLPRWLHEIGVNVVLAGGMGARAVNLLAQNNIEAILGVPMMGVTELAEAYLNGKLISGASACEHHGCGDGHHH
jgi:ATP-binding protein involved in chromosome partitioning